MWILTLLVHVKSGAIQLHGVNRYITSWITQWVISIKRCYFFFKTKNNFTEKLLMKWLYRLAWEYWLNTEEAIRMRKILPHDIRMQKNPQTKEGISWIFTDFHGVMLVQSPTCTAAQKFHHWKSFIHAATFSNTLYWLIFFKKTLTLKENSLNI